MAQNGFVILPNLPNARIGMHHRTQESVCIYNVYHY